MCLVLQAVMRNVPGLMNGIDHVIDYKATKATKEVGESQRGMMFILIMWGPLLEAVLFKINLNARIVICGAISNYASLICQLGLGI
ncbi:MAG: hypothetical protein Ct9H90mP13_00830 [Pseudomonadota bacterium]|nr:MAG: hypothetical protein Ct9H90mP13_00830 [Pseudomonadota bacterium]